MQYKILSIGLFMLIILAGCTQNTSQEYEPINVEVACPPSQEICVLGAPGLLNELSIYSDSETSFSVILRNNLEGDEARNVEVKLKNLSPFYVIEGYKFYSGVSVESIITTGRQVNETDLTCYVSQGRWKPDEERQSLYVPEPQFISDLGLPFASKMLDIMYPNEEVEFIWNLETPSRQEIANVAYEHSIDYEVSYDYKSSILQTIYAISEQEYQRVLSLSEDISLRKGTMTSSIGALNVATTIEEPVRVNGVNSQFSVTYKVNNKRSGIPLNPALFLFQYPKGTDFVGAFSGKNSLNSYGYIDLKAAAEYYQDINETEQLICLPDDFDKYDQEISKFYISNDSKIRGKNICILYDKMIDYIVRNFKDLEFNRTSPNLVLKFLYPINLLNEMNYLYFPMTTTESIDVSKYYSFRLKAKYRYSFSGTDNIIIIPSEKFYNPSTEPQAVSFFGDMGFNMENKADSYSMSNETQKMTKGNYFVDSSIFNLKNGDFLQIVKLNSLKAPLTKSCTVDSDCDSIATNSYCDTVKGICNYTKSEYVTTTTPLTKIADLAKVNLNMEKKVGITKDSKIISTVLNSSNLCSKGPLTAYLFLHLYQGNFSFYIQAENKRNNIQSIRTMGEGVYSIGPLILNCSAGAVNTLVLNSTAPSTTVNLYDLILFNDSRIIKDNFLTRNSSYPSGYFRLNLNPSHSYYQMRATGSFKSGEVFNHYIKYKTILGEADYSLNASNNKLNSINWNYDSLTYTAKSDMSSIDLFFKNEDVGQKDAIIYFSLNEPSVSNFESLDYSVVTYKNESFYEPFFYNIKIGYSPRDGFLKKVYDNSQNYIRLDDETYYINHLPYVVKSEVLDRSNNIYHNIILEGDDDQAKLDNITKFIDYKSFIEINELNILESENGLVNVFSDSDLIGYQLRDYDYTTPAYANTIPLSMKIMNYNQDESVFFKRFNIEDNAVSLVMLYSDKLTSTTNRLMFYVIDNSISVNNPVRSNDFNISLMQGSMVAPGLISLSNSLIPISVIKKNPYEQISSLMNLKSILGVTDCSTNHNQFYQEVNKKPVLKIDYSIHYGGNAYEATSWSSLSGTIIIGDYNSPTEINSALGTTLSTTSNFVKGVVSICKV
jgi:hypothetical protein